MPHKDANICLSMQHKSHLISSERAAWDRHQRRTDLPMQHISKCSKKSPVTSMALCYSDDADDEDDEEEE